MANRSVRMSAVGILVAEDSEPFRRFVVSMLRTDPALRVLDEVSDGVDAVERAQSLKPDLVLLDVGLPTLSGLEVSRRIRAISPKSTILFVSENNCPEIAAEALRAGASGFVVKSDAGSELLTAIHTVLQDKQFVSSTLAGYVLTGLKKDRASDRFHQIHLYSDEEHLLDRFADFAEALLIAGNAVIVAATEEHRKSLLQRLQLRGADMGTAIERGSYIPLDAADTLSRCMVNGLPDPAQTFKLVDGLILEALQKGHPRVAACGECAPLLWARNKADAAIRFEELCDEIARTRNLDILCGYPLSSFRREQDKHVFQRICAEHSAAHSG